VRLGAGVLVVGVALAMIGLAVAQRSDTASLQVELSRYLPYYWLAAPCLLASAAAALLGRRWLVASMVAPLVLMTLVADFQWNHPQPAGESRRIRLMTYNAKLFVAPQGSAAYQAVEREVSKQDPDILVMQHSAGVRSNAPGTKASLFGLPNVFALNEYVVASRLPMRGCVLEESPGFVQCRFDVDGTELTLANVHLASPRDGLMAALNDGLDGGRTWALNYEGRLLQSRALARQLQQMPRPLVLAGDLNAPVSSPVVRELLNTGLRDSFSVAGRGYGFSYGISYGATGPEEILFLRIDHILASADVAFTRSIVGGRAADSEHRPVIADFVLRR
jgi:vancomycin resistance protein VanJ